MDRQQLIDAIVAEIDRIWGDNSFSGDWGEYEWLEANYGITEDQDADWIGILNHEIGEDDPDDSAEFREFVRDDARVLPFLEGLLERYRSNAVPAPSDIPEVIRRTDLKTGEEIREVRPR